MRWRLCAAGAVLGLVMSTGQASADLSPAPAQSVSAGGSTSTVSHSYIAKGTRCVTGAAGRPLLRTSFLMFADQFSKTSVQNFILHARLIPHGATLAGQTWTRKYSTDISVSLIGGAGHRLLMATPSPPLDTQYDWDLQVKLQWKRMSRVDWNTTLVFKFDESKCPGYNGDGTSLPDQALRTWTEVDHTSHHTHCRSGTRGTRRCNLRHRERE